MDLTERSQLTRWLATQLLLTLMVSFVGAILVHWVLVSFGRVAPFVATWAITLVAVGAIRLQRLALPGTGARRRRRQDAAGEDTTWARAEQSTSKALGGKPPEPIAPLPETLDRRFRRLARHTDRLTYAVVETRHYESGVRPVLKEIATDRVRRHHGFDSDAEPDRARTLMGEDLWQALTSDRSTPPTTADLDRWLTALEALGEETPTTTERLRTP